MILRDKKINTLFLYWVITSLLLIFLLVFIGGFTRLTGSGLSITQWELLKGILPPLNDTSWDLYFNEYKKIPQYHLLNLNMTLEEFKFIFYWEYVHRAFARFIGLFVLLPLIYFYYSKKIEFHYIKICILIFFLIVFQGIIGWYMVKSGLVNKISVSHYRLSIHLSNAIIIISIFFWLLMNIISKNNKPFFKFSKNYLPFQFLIFFIFCQIILGAFVSGLDAGRIYQTWPLMGDTYLPDDIVIKDNFLNFDNHSLVQFYHRNLAYFIIIYILFLSIIIFKSKMKNLYVALFILITALIVQVVLGIITLISDINIFLASGHQITGIFLMLSALNLYYLKSK